MLIFSFHSPEFTIALVRTPFLSPRYAQFRVPLNFNKLDIRDYLERVYGVGVVSVRSYIEQQPITRIDRDQRNFGAWRRPQSIKRMTVELREPFVWPEEPTDFTRYVPVPFHSINLHIVEFTIHLYCRLVTNAFPRSTAGRRNPGTLRRNTSKRCARRTSKSPTAPRSQTKNCGRHLRNRPRN